ncbi:MAG: aspartate carbamoyltransferase catalytic subunit [Wenzhouxiangellaceae bacterium]|nr:aspartate carbamoyltransferase catalytic subunit [Wenzhouxiangellaceae bacterium]
MKHDLLTIEQLDDTTIRSLIDRTLALANGAPPAARSGRVATLFFENSTRTRISFELAARRLGLEVVHVDHSRSSASKGESLIDTARTLAAMDISTIVLRHPDDHVAEQLAEALGNDGPAIINGGDGCHAHPSQALLDAAVIERRRLKWPELTVLLVGDIRHSRVARSDIALFLRLGVAELRVAGPPELLPDALPEPVRHFDRLDDALEGSDVVMCLRIQRERIKASGYPDGERYHADWGLTLQRGERLDQALIMHPGPVNRGVEIAGELVDGPRSLINEQVRTGVHLRTALFEWMIPAHRAPIA